MNFKSRSEKYLEEKLGAPIISPNMAKSVSSYRKQVLGDEVNNGLFRDGATKYQEQGSNVAYHIGQVKNAQVVSGGYGGYQTSGAGNTLLQTPEIYSPLWLNSNLNLPRDRATLNAWCRAFFALNAFVHNAINLHSTYPISKLNIKCPNKDVEKFFNEMIEEIDLMNVCVQIAQEYWLLGEAFPYAEYDETSGKWSRILLQNPDYVVLNKSVSGEPSIQLKPDEHLKQIIFSNKSKDIEQRKNLSPYIVDSIKKGGNIPLENFNVSHLARKISPYSVHGTGLPVCIFRQLMLFDQLRECYDKDTEVLTNHGFKKINELVEITESFTPNSEYVNGVETDNEGNVTGVLKLKENIKVACFNSDTEEIEYHIPNELHMSHYEGEMIHFKSRNFDTLVSPNHKMWVQKKQRIKGQDSWTNWKKIKASDISPTTTYRFRGTVDWVGEDKSYVNVLNKEVPIKLYLKMLGYVISEGCLTQNYIDLCQNITSDCIEDMQHVIKSFGDIFNKKVSEMINPIKDYKKYGFKSQPSDRWSGRINSKQLMNYFIKEISVNGESHTASFKKIPNWVKKLSIENLNILLNTLVFGDGSNLNNKKSKACKYYTSSKQLADDVQEIAFKCGFSPVVYSRQRKGVHREYIVSWSDANDGVCPILMPNKKYPEKINKINYNGTVWCFEVPTGLFITRRNGKIAIHGNSKYVQATNMINPLTLVKIGGAGQDGFKPTYQNLQEWRDIFAAASADKDFKIFTHDGVAVEKIGSGQGIYDISGDITQLMKEIFIGLQVPSVVMDGGSDVTYANGGVALDVLRQRYMQFRNMLSTWLKNKIFAPISKIQKFYDYKDGEKHLIVPDVDWNYMSIFDASDHIGNLITLSGGEGENKRASLHTLYRSMGMDFDDEQRKMRKEAVAAEIVKKEKESLSAMPLNELRTLSDEDEIQEIEGPPGEMGDASGGRPGDPSMPGLPGGGGRPSDLDLPDADIPGLNIESPGGPGLEEGGGGGAPTEGPPEL